MKPEKIKKDIENHFGIPDLSTKERTRPLPQLKGLYYRIASKITDAFGDILYNDKDEIPF